MLFSEYKKPFYYNRYLLLNFCNYYIKAQIFFLLFISSVTLNVIVSVLSKIEATCKDHLFKSHMPSFF